MIVRINVPSESRKGKRINLCIPVPLSIITAKFIWKHVPEDVQHYEQQSKELVRILKEFKRQNGQWNLVEVYSPSDNTKVVIRV